ncbi:MAG: hypothetical protein N7Q72_07590, partial [Spiroplasma sp. Tabriz.8]|nr:hypothetical protein [Spiroplasma sp. Tabriz.8]
NNRYQQRCYIIIVLLKRVFFVSYYYYYYYYYFGLFDLSSTNDLLKLILSGWKENSLIFLLWKFFPEFFA